ncbi:AAA family ATPase [Kitasatospora indigofera]|uniref:AAA family ATPase n=1 Tax=Kitasatospora indigofera TaxID=67307 RepID=UPI00363CD865
MEHPTPRPSLTGPSLIVLRGNSAAGKTSTAWHVRALFGAGLALISQDNVRINVLAEPDVAGGAAVEMIDAMVRTALRRDYHVLLEGVLATARYSRMLRDLHQDHPERSFFFYLDVPWKETLARHATRRKQEQFGAEQMAEWFIPHDVLDGVGEISIGPCSSLDQSAHLILNSAFRGV